MLLGTEEGSPAKQFRQRVLLCISYMWVYFTTSDGSHHRQAAAGWPQLAACSSLATNKGLVALCIARTCATVPCNASQATS